MELRVVAPVSVQGWLLGLRMKAAECSLETDNINNLWTIDQNWYSTDWEGVKIIYQELMDWKWNIKQYIYITVRLFQLPPVRVN